MREMLQPHTTSIPTDMVASVSARDERFNFLAISGPYLCELDEGDYDSQDTDHDSSKPEQAKQEPK